MNKLLIDFLPLLLFFITLFVGNRIYPDEGIYLATGVAILASTVQMMYFKIKKLPISGQNWLNFIVILIFGGLTIFLHNDTFIKWKPTLVYWGFSVALIGARFFKRNFIQDLLSKEINLPTPIWNILNKAWALFFLLMGLLNLWVAYHFSTETWATFKVFGSTLLLIIFSMGQSIYLAKHLKKE